MPVEAEADEMAAAEDDPKEYRWETGYEKVKNKERSSFGSAEDR